MDNLFSNKVIIKTKANKINDNDQSDCLLIINDFNI